MFKTKKTKGFFRRRHNPFSIQPNTNLIGLEQDKDRLMKYIENHSICFLNGPAGVGKSSLLYWVTENLVGYKIIYLDAKGIDEYFDIALHLKKSTFFLKRWLGRYSSNIVVLLDEAQAGNTKLIDSLEALWNQMVIKSIVITQINPHLINYPKSFTNRLGDRVIRLGRLNSAKFHELVKLRTNGKHPFTDDAISMIAEKADFIPRKALELCEIMLNELEGKEEISEDDVTKLIGTIEAEKLEQDILDLEEDCKIDESVLLPLGNVDKMDNISPMEKTIIKLLLESGKTALQVMTILNTSAGSIGKQLSRLTKAGIVQVVSSRRPKVYGISQAFKESLKKVS